MRVEKKKKKLTFENIFLLAGSLVKKKASAQVRVKPLIFVDILLHSFDGSLSEPCRNVTQHLRVNHQEREKGIELAPEDDVSNQVRQILVGKDDDGD